MSWILFWRVKGAADRKQSEQTASRDSKRHHMITQDDDRPEAYSIFVRSALLEAILTRKETPNGAWEKPEMQPHPGAES
jgi:hypothetical protein